MPQPAQQQLPNLHVVVAGDDRIAYSYGSKHESGSWKHQLLDDLKGYLDLKRLHFPGLINYGELEICFSVRTYIVILRDLMLSAGVCFNLSHAAVNCL